MPPQVRADASINVRDEILGAGPFMAVEAEIHAFALGDDVARGSAIHGKVMNELRPEIKAC